MRPAPSAGTATATPMSWSRSFPATAAQAGAARRFLAAILDGSPAAADAVLCLSELATNAIVHSDSGRPGGTFTVAVRLGQGSLWVEVRDQGGLWRRGGPSEGEHSTDTRGRGLLIVGRTAREWGCEGVSETGWTIWFALDWS
jgi:anti-sigma regulatory factor (Ser/Thr protein kinase)